MDRVRGNAPTGGADPPVYLDPNDVATPPLITFQTIAAQPPTSLTSEQMNLISEEGWKLTRALGLTPASDDDSQFAEAFDQGDRLPFTHGDVPAPQGFIPVFTPTPTNVTFSVQTGAYCRVGNFVWVSIDVAWVNNEVGEAGVNAVILEPFDIVQLTNGPSSFPGLISLDISTFGTLNGAGVPEMQALLGTGLFFQLTAQIGAAPTIIDLGDADSRRVSAQLFYTTDGDFNY